METALHHLHDMRIMVAMDDGAIPAIRLCPGHATLVFAAPAGWTWRKQRGAFHNLWLVLEGRGILIADGARHELGIGSVCVLPPGLEIQVEHDRRRPIRNFSAHFTIADGIDESRFPLIVSQEALFPDLRTLALQALHCTAPGDALGLIQATHLVSAMLCLVLRAGRTVHEGPHAAKLRLLGERIRLHPEQPWTLTSIARELGLSRSQAGRGFHARFGMPPTRFAIHCRMERARQMLTDTDLPIGRIAGLLGYGDIFYFSRHFRSVVGCPPSHLRHAQGTGIR